MKSGRRQNGYVCEKSGSWIGRYRSYRSGIAEQVALKLGEVSTISREQAQSKLRSIIELERDKTAVIRKVGETRVLGARGAAAELIVCADLLNKGFEVYRALSPQSSCDVAALDNSGKFLRVEVKKVSMNSRGIVSCNVSRNAGNFDLIAFVFEDGRIVYRKPEEIINVRYPLGSRRSDFEHPECTIN